MTLSQKIVKGSSVLASGQILIYCCSLARNIILARMLSKADFGITAAIAIGMTLFELAGKLAIGQQLIQSKQGDNEQFQSNAHLCQFLAGCFSAVLIALCGKPIAVLFKVPQAAWAFSFAGVFCFLHGLQHLDAVRLMRVLNYKKRWIIDVVPELTLVLLAFPIVYWIRDYRAVILLLFVKSCMKVFLSHAIAERRYTWRFDKDRMRQILTFGAPLVLNSLLIFGYQQADQTVVGAAYSIADLAAYSLAFSLTMIPGYMVQHVINPIMFPLLSQVQSNFTEFIRRYRVSIEFLTMGSIGVSCFLVLFGEGLITTVFGPKYAGSGMIVAWLAIANSFRLIRTAPSQAAMSLANTFNHVYANIFRVSGFILVLAVVFLGKPPVWVAACGCIGEMLALYAAVSRLKKINGIPGSVALKPTVICIITMTIAMLLLHFVIPHLGWIQALVFSLTFTFCSLFIAIRSLKSFRDDWKPFLIAAKVPPRILWLAEKVL